MTITNEERVRWMRSFAGRLAKEEKSAKTAQKLFETAEALELADKGLTVEDATVIGSRRVARLLAPGTRVRVHLLSERKQELVVMAVGRYDVVGQMPAGNVVMVPKHAVLFYEFLDGIAGTEG